MTQQEENASSGPNGRRLKILIFIDHDIMFRHFIASGAFSMLLERCDARFVIPERGHKRTLTHVDVLEGLAPVEEMLIDERRLRGWKWLYIADKFRWRSGQQHKILREVQRRSIGWKAIFLFKLLSLPGIYGLFGRLVRLRARQAPNRPLEDLFDRFRPDVVLHPTVLAGVFIDDLVDICRRRKVPFVAIMNSWDNPSTKYAASGCPDWLLVWGEQTWRHSLEFMGMPGDRVVRFGAAQFDVYRGPPRLTPEQFRERHGIPAGKRILLYAGSSKGTDEYQDLCQLDEWIVDGKLPDVEVVYRPHPWGEGGRGGERILDADWRHVRIESTMRAYLEKTATGWSGIYQADYRDTHDVLSSIDALVSPLSTIILEAALHGKPALCFLPDDELEAQHYQLSVPLIHFDEMFTMEEFLLAEGRKELLPRTKALMDLAGDPEFERRLELICRYFVDGFDRPYGERLAEFIENTVCPPTAAAAQAVRKGT
jgi:CDP-glycerol glycerophosphotransferase (TagB/SpsB family)